MNHCYTALLLLLTLLSSSSWATSSADTFLFSSPAKQQLALTIAKELRCLQCKNQNLLESNAAGAQQLRLQLYQMVEEGKDQQQIKTLLQQQYGDFILYHPPLNTATLLLWGAPLLLFSLLLCRFITLLRGQFPHHTPPTINSMGEKK